MVNFIGSTKFWTAFSLVILCFAIAFYAATRCSAQFFWHANKLGLYSVDSDDAPRVDMDGDWVAFPQWLDNTQGLPYPAYALTSAAECGDARRILFLKPSKSELETFRETFQLGETISLPAGTMAIIPRQSENPSESSITLLSTSSSWILVASDIDTARSVLSITD